MFVLDIYSKAKEDYKIIKTIVEDMSFKEAKLCNKYKIVDGKDNMLTVEFNKNRFIIYNCGGQAKVLKLIDIYYADGECACSGYLIK